MSEIFKTYIGLHVKKSSFLSDFTNICIFSTYLRKITQISNFMKIRPVGAELCAMRERTDKTKLTVAFRNFMNAPKSSESTLLYKTY